MRLAEGRDGFAGVSSSRTPAARARRRPAGDPRLARKPRPEEPHGLPHSVQRARHQSRQCGDGRLQRGGGRLRQRRQCRSRRPQGESEAARADDGHDLDHYADDLKAVTDHLDLTDPIHVGHSTGGGEVVRYLGRHGDKNVAKAAIISAVPPLMVKTPANPLGLPKSVFDDLQAQLFANRAKFYYDLPAGPFYGFNRPGVKTIEPVVWNWWRQGMMGGAKAGYDGIVAFSQTDFTEDLKKISVPVLVMHSEDDQIVPYQAAGPLSAKLLKNGTLKTYKDYPHGMPTTHADVINADLLAFIES